MRQKPSIFITRQLPGDAITRLKKVARVRVWPEDRPIPRSDLLASVKRADGLISLLTDRIDGPLMSAAPRLKVISNYAVGFDNIDLAAATQRGIFVTNTPGKLISNSVAEFTLALILSMVKRIPEADAFTRRGKYKGWSPTLFLGDDLFGKTFGIVGGGQIGTRLAEMLRDGFGMHILYNDIKRNLYIEEDLGGQFATLPSLLKWSDVVSLHVPLTPETRHLISTKQFELMKSGAYLVNTARGPVVDEKALVRALKRGQIKYAALDVYEAEPAIDVDMKDTLELRKLSNTVLTPHIASASFETRAEMADLAVDNLIDVFVKGRKPRALINKDVKSKS